MGNVSITYAELVDGDTIIDKSGNRWGVVDVTLDGAGVAFGLTDPATGVRMHSLTKQQGDEVTVDRPEPHVEKVARLEAEVDAAQRGDLPTGQLIEMAVAAEVDAAQAPKCWRAECREACYYPDTCGETPEPAEAPLTTEETAKALDGEVIAEATASEEDARNLAAVTGKPYTIPAFADLTMLEKQSHLFLVHGIFAADLKTKEQLRDAHDEAHRLHDTAEISSKYIAHVHGKPEEEWSPDA